MRLQRFCCGAGVSLADQFVDEGLEFVVVEDTDELALDAAVADGQHRRHGRHVELFGQFGDVVDVHLQYRQLNRVSGNDYKMAFLHLISIFLIYCFRNGKKIPYFLIIILLLKTNGYVPFYFNLFLITL